jgi:uncharacterized DUF497 family protein
MMSGIAGKRVPFAHSDGFYEHEEVRHMHLCVDDDRKVLMMVTTMRDDEVVRVISIRRADENERANFQMLTDYAERQ